jgi:hypothetical protein
MSKFNLLYFTGQDGPHKAKFDTLEDRTAFLEKTKPSDHLTFDLDDNNEIHVMTPSGKNLFEALWKRGAELYDKAKESDQ